jgi:co-chaperonin GroES (HSP10)
MQASSKAMSTGVTIAQQAEILPAGTKLRLLRDRILLKPLDWKPSEIVEVIRHGRPVRGEVIAIGAGTHKRTYAKDRKSFKEGKHFIPTELKPGDVVELGGLNVFDGRGYAFPEVIIGTERHIICQEQDVAMVVEQ